MLAGSLSLESLLDRLAQVRPVFHSEADFQLAFAWEARWLKPSLQVRLETRPEPNIRLDVLLTGEDGIQTAIELKYLVRSWHGQCNGELYDLKNQGARDIRSYDVVKDIVRVERFVTPRPGANGALVCMTNDPGYWHPPANKYATNAEAFRIHEGAVLSGVREWGPLTGAGSSKGREAPLELAGEYHLTWHDYSHLPGHGGEFRTLVVPVEEVT